MLEYLPIKIKLSETRDSETDLTQKQTKTNKDKGEV